MRKNQYKRLRKQLVKLRESIFSLTDNVMKGVLIDNAITLLDEYKDLI